MIEDQLEKLRKEYLKIKAPDYLVQNGWVDLQTRLSAQESPNRRFFPKPALIFASVILLFFAGSLTAAQAAKPGDVLYPVKLLSDDLQAKITGKEEIKLEKRAQEFIDLSNSSSEHLEEAARQYQKTLDESKNQAEKSGRQQEFRQSLEEQEEKLRQAQDNNPSSQDLDEAIKETQRVRGEVQGTKDEHSNGEDNNSHEGNQSNQENRGQEHDSENKD